MKENLQKTNLHEAISNGVDNRIRPIVMIALMGSMKYIAGRFIFRYEI